MHAQCWCVHWWLGCKVTPCAVLYDMVRMHARMCLLGGVRLQRCVHVIFVLNYVDDLSCFLLLPCKKR